MSIFRNSEEAPPVQVEGNEVVLPQSDDQPKHEERKRKLPKLKWW